MKTILDEKVKAAFADIQLLYIKTKILADGDYF